MRLRKLLMATAFVLPAAHSATGAKAAALPSLNDVQTIVVIYAENRSFDNLYGSYPGANNLSGVTLAQARQLDRDGSVMATLPQVWGGLTAAGQTPVVTQAQTAGQPNKPFAINKADGYDVPTTEITRDLWHRFYQNQMQIDGGKNDKFAAWADSGGLVMGRFFVNRDTLPLEGWARQYTLADNFFQGAFGGSFLNHQFLICSCAPIYPQAQVAISNPSIAVVDGGTYGTSLTPSSTNPASALDGPPSFVSDGNLTPDLYAVNTMQPPYQPSGNAAVGSDYADTTKSNTMPAQTQTTIGTLLDAAGINWAWYAGAWSYGISHTSLGTTPGGASTPNFQYHHQPFNYYAAYAPGTAARTQHLLDGGLDGTNLIADIDAGRLPAVTFYKPQGNLNEHNGYTDATSGDEHIAEVLTHLRNGPQWKHMVVVVTYDEFGGFWDHVAPPKGDRFGPGTRIPALIISPYAKRHNVDHTQYDTTSVLRLIQNRFGLPHLAGTDSRDAALVANGYPAMGDLTNALNLAPAAAAR